MEVTRLFDILDNYKEQKPGQKVALAHIAYKIMLIM